MRWIELKYFYSHVIHIHMMRSVFDYENLCCEKSHDVRWTSWEFMIVEKYMNGELVRIDDGRLM